MQSDLCNSHVHYAENFVQVYKNVIMANEYQSSRLCEALYTKCEDRMDQLQVLRLPSMAKFNAGFLQCNQSFDRECIGPSKANYEQRMVKVIRNLCSSIFSFLFLMKCYFPYVAIFSRKMEFHSVLSIKSVREHL